MITIKIQLLKVEEEERASVLNFYFQQDLKILTKYDKNQEIYEYFKNIMATIK